MTEPEVLFGRYFVLAALALLLVSRALIAIVRAARARAASPRYPGLRSAQHAPPAHVVDAVAGRAAADVQEPQARARPASRPAPRRAAPDVAPPAGGSAPDLRAAIVTMEILGPPRAMSAY
jgi:hypothetical protein